MSGYLSEIYLLYSFERCVLSKPYCSGAVLDTSHAPTKIFSYPASLRLLEIVQSDGWTVLVFTNPKFHKAPIDSARLLLMKDCLAGAHTGVGQ